MPINLYPEMDRNLCEQEAQASEWVLYDDTALTAKGAWENVIDYCIDVQCRPCVLVFERDFENRSFPTQHELSDQVVLKMWEKSKELTANQPDYGDQLEILRQI